MASSAEHWNVLLGGRIKEGERAKETFADGHEYAVRPLPVSLPPSDHAILSQLPFPFSLWGYWAMLAAA